MFGYPSGETLLVRQSPSGHNLTVELKQDSYMPRFFTGIAEKFRSKQSDGNVVVSMLLHTFGAEIYGLTLCRDGNLRVWSCSKGQLVAITDIFTETNESNRLLNQGSQNHILKKTVENCDGEIKLVIFMSFSRECQFHIFRPYFQGGQFRIQRISTLYSPSVSNFLGFFAFTIIV